MPEDSQIAALAKNTSLVQLEIYPFHPTNPSLAAIEPLRKLPNFRYLSLEVSKVDKLVFNFRSLQKVLGPLVTLTLTSK